MKPPRYGWRDDSGLTTYCEDVRRAMVKGPTLMERTTAALVFPFVIGHGVLCYLWSRLRKDGRH